MAAAGKAKEHSRWLDSKGRGNTSMDLLMRSVHSGALGNPIDRGSVMQAITHPEQPRGGLPKCITKGYGILGRTDPFALGEEDEAAFEHLEQLLQPIQDRRRPASASSIRPSSGSSRGKPRIAPPAARPRAANEADADASRSHRPRSAASPNTARPALDDGGTLVDHFPLPPPIETEEEEEAVAERARPQHPRPASKAKVATRGPTSLRSPDVLIRFGERLPSASSTASRTPSLHAAPLAGGRTASAAHAHATRSTFSTGSLHAGGRRARARSTSQLRTDRPNVAPLIAPLPTPLFGMGHGARMPARAPRLSHDAPSEASATSSAAGRAFEAAASRYPQSHMRLMIAEMMLGMQREHAHTYNLAQSLGASPSAASLPSMRTPV